MAMKRDRQEFLKAVLDGYAGHYDITKTESATDGLPLAAKAVLHVTESGFVLTRKAQMWSADSDEYVYFFSAPILTDTLCEKAIQYAYDDGMSKIDLKEKRNHMCTRITMIFLADETEEAAMQRIRGCRLYKSFQFSLKGWMEFHAAAVDLGKHSVAGNRYGRVTAEFLKNVLDPKPGKKNKNVLSILKRMLD